MEKYRASTTEQEVIPKMSFAPPMVDILKDAELVAEIFPDHAEELAEQIEHHNHAAGKVTGYLDKLEGGEATLSEKEQFYDGVVDLLKNPDLQRLVLFLPFESFPTPEEDSASSENFRESFVDAWSRMFYTVDTRANFVDGDVLEVEARAGDPEQVVKAAHLTPWVVKSGIVDLPDVIDFVSEINNPVLGWSLLDMEPLLEDFELVSDDDRAALADLRANLPPKPEVLPPKFITPERQAWLEQRDQPIIRPEQPLADLSENLSERIPRLESELAEAQEIVGSLSPEESYQVVWFGGSRLKGYDTEKSDTDFWIPMRDTSSDTENIHTVTVDAIREDPARRASVVFDTIWIGDDVAVQDLQRGILPIYFSEQNHATRDHVTERLEQDLLEYRLLHKGYEKFYPDSNPEYKKYTQMDGQSAFYETSYRIIATKIFANSIFVPRLNLK